MKIKRVLLVVGALSNCILLSGCGGTYSSGWKYDAKEIWIEDAPFNSSYYFPNENNNLKYKEESTNKWFRIVLKYDYENFERVFMGQPYQIVRKTF